MKSSLELLNPLTLGLEEVVARPTRGIVRFGTRSAEIREEHITVVPHGFHVTAHAQIAFNGPLQLLQVRCDVLRSLETLSAHGLQPRSSLFSFVPYHVLAPE